MTTEIKVSIPVNDYMQPQEVREEVVQAVGVHLREEAIHTRKY